MLNARAQIYSLRGVLESLTTHKHLSYGQAKAQKIKDKFLLLMHDHVEATSSDSYASEEESQSSNSSQKSLDDGSESSLEVEVSQAQN